MVAILYAESLNDLVNPIGPSGGDGAFDDMFVEHAHLSELGLAIYSQRTIDIRRAQGLNCVRRCVQLHPPSPRPSSSP